MRKALVRLEQLQAEVAKAQKDAAEWEARALGHAKAARFAEDANTPLKERVAGLEKALRAMCAFHIAVAQALDDGPGDGVCELSEETIRLGEVANDSLTGLDPAPAVTGTTSDSAPIRKPAAGDAKGK